MTKHKYACSGCGTKLTEYEWNNGHLCEDCKLNDEIIVEDFECINCGRKHQRDWKLDHLYHRLCRDCYEKKYFKENEKFYKNLK